MSDRLATPPRTAPAPERTRPATGTLVLLASTVISMLAASSTPTPLYGVYQAEWGFSPITTTVVFGVYALAVLLALLVVGTLSDHVGRKPVLLVALAGQVVSMVVFTAATGVPELFAARIVQGVATGAAVGAVGAAMIDLDRVRGTLANVVAPPIGTATGALVSAVVVQYLPAPTRTIYLVLLVVFVLQAVGVARIPETVSRAPGAWASLKPEIALPRAVRGAVLTAAPVLFATWALAGFYASLSPATIRGLLDTQAVLPGGLGLSVLAGVAGISVYLARNADPRRVMLLGIGALVVGVVATMVFIRLGSATGFFVGTAIAGVGFGSGFNGGIRTVVPLAAAHERAGVLSLLYVVSYLGMGAPAVLAGVLVVHGGGLTATTYEYGTAVVVLAVLALLGLRRRSSVPTPA